MEFLNEPQGLGEVGLQIVLLVLPPAIGVWHAIVDVHAGGHHAAGGAGGAGAGHAVAVEGRAVLIAAAVVALPQEGGVELVEEVTVTGLHIHAIKARGEGQCRRALKVVLQPP